MAWDSTTGTIIQLILWHHLSSSFVYILSQVCYSICIRTRAFITLSCNAKSECPGVSTDSEGEDEHDDWIRKDSGTPYILVSQGI